MYRELYIFVEGFSDKMFFESIFKNYFIQEKGFNNIIIREYSQKKSDIKKLIETYIKRKSIDYILICDFDSHGDVSLSQTERISRVNSDFGNVLDISKIFVVVEMIEAWYLAGINETFTTQKKLPYQYNTEIFDRTKLKPKNKSVIRTELYSELLENFSKELAMTRNISFSLFVENN